MEHLENIKKPENNIEKGLSSSQIIKREAARSALGEFWDKHIKKPLMYGVLTGGMFLAGEKAFSQNNLPKLKDGYSWRFENGVNFVVDRNGKPYRGNPQDVLYTNFNNKVGQQKDTSNKSEGYYMKGDIVYGPDNKPVIGDTRAIRARLNQKQNGIINNKNNEQNGSNVKPIKVTSFEEITLHATNKYQLFLIRRSDGSKEALYAKINSKGGLKTKPGPNVQDLAE